MVSLRVLSGSFYVDPCFRRFPQYSGVAGEDIGRRTPSEGVDDSLLTERHTMAAALVDQASDGHCECLTDETRVRAERTHGPS